MWPVPRPAYWPANEGTFDTRAMNDALLHTRPYHNSQPIHLSSNMYNTEGWGASDQGYLQSNYVPEYGSPTQHPGFLDYAVHILDGHAHKHNRELYHYPTPYQYGAYQYANSGTWDHANIVGQGNSRRHPPQHNHALDGKTAHRHVAAHTLTNMRTTVSQTTSRTRYPSKHLPRSTTKA
jgi:hypothetical protein